MRHIYRYICLVDLAFLLLGCSTVRGRSREVSEEGTIHMAVHTFDLEDVRLLDGPFRAAQEANCRYLLALDSDRLLYNFRANAGLATPGEPMGGWEALDVEIRGHFVGHYLSACALMYASTGDEVLKAKADAIVAELAKCQQALGGEYLSAFPEEFFDRLEAGIRVWVPWYVIHKILAGMQDMYVHCGNEQALQVAESLVTWAKKRTGRLNNQQMARVLNVEFGGMADVLYNLYGLTGDSDYVDLANRFDHKRVLDPLADGRDALKGLHVNTTLPKIIGAARGYELTGGKRYRDVAEFAWRQITGFRCYATGGTSNHEHWRTAPGELAHELSFRTQECCTTYNMLKLTRHVFTWTADLTCADYYERALFNGILGTQNPEDGMLMYYVPLETGHTKTFGKPYDSFWCCYGTGIESFSKLGDSIYFHDDKGIYVNLFIASRVHWPAKGLRLEQITRFPDEPLTTLIVHTHRPTAFALHIRVPYWATRGVQVKLNSDAVRVEAKPASYLTLDREWKEGDRVEVSLPMSLHTHPMPDDPEKMAIMYGPLVLAGLTEQDRYFLADAKELPAWIKPVEGRSLTFRTTGQPLDLTLIPLNRVVHERYGVYWVVTKKGSPRHERILAEEELQRKRLEKLVDVIKPADNASEEAHNVQGENTQSGIYGNRGFRHAHSPGWWSWDLKVLPDVPMILLCTYWGSDIPPRTFDILVDGEKIATQSLNNNEPGKMFDARYKIPVGLTKGKDKITVKFRPHEGNTAGGVFGCAILKE